MKGWTLITVGGVCFVVGGVWFLQGIGVIGGSFMTSSPTWLVIGLVVAVAGLVATALGARGLRRQT
jgi:hypothetical protein